MVTLFDTTTINGMTLTNRFVRSATYEAMANEDETASPPLIDLMVQLAHGGVGLIITSFAYIQKDGHCGPRQLGVYSDAFLPRLSEMAQAVHRANGKIVLQIVHGGVQSSAELIGKLPLGPSGLEGEKGPISQQMTVNHIQDVVSAFGQAAARAKQAGFDGVQLHGAHGYLLSEFLSPFFNKRIDQYGGNIDNRARIVLDAYNSVRNAVGDQYPVMIKLNSEDFLEGGLSSKDMLQVAAMLEQVGIDAIEMSGGTTWALYQGHANPSFARTEKKEVYYQDAAKRYKKTVDVPLILVGGIRSYDVAEQLVEDGVTDYIALCRPLIREPDLINRWKAGDTRQADCISDNACLGTLSEPNGLRCVHVTK